MLAVVPSEELRAAVGEVDGVRVEVWDAEGDPPAGVEFWVPPYGTRPEVVGRAGDLPGLRTVQLQSAGYDGMLELLPEGVRLCNARGVHDDATAEHAVGLTLAVLRGIPEAVRATGHWTPMPGRRSLAGSRVLVLGYGSIGRAVAERLLPMKARVTGVASRAREDDLLDRVHGLDELDGLLPHQHVVIVLLPLTEETRGLVSDGVLSRLPAGAVVVNVARGPVVDTAAVLRQAGRLRFALDVTDPEPLPDGHPLWSAAGVLVTPHVAGGTTAMLPRVASLVRSQLERVVSGRPPAHVVR
jgi:phosphoglycerate dehydrogenase-like enzyme